MKFNKMVLILISGILILLTGCSPSAEDVVLDEPVEIAASQTPLPTATTHPTDTPIPPTATLIPTETPVPTDTPTPLPTETPTITPTLSPAALRFSPGDPVRIGYLLWETHPLGIDMKRAMEIAIADFGGEIHGHPFELTGFDSECNELAAQRGAQILVRDDSVVGILGTTCSRGALRAAPIVTDGDRVMVSASNTSPELTAPDSRLAGYFRTVPSDIFQVKAAAQYAYNNLGVRKMATVYAGSESIMKLQSEALCQDFTELGGECVLERSYENGSTYMLPIVNSLIDATPDAVYFMGWSNEEVAAFIAEVEAAPALDDIAVFVWNSYNSPGFLESAGESAVGVYISVASLDFNPSAEYGAFLDTYRNLYGEEVQSEFHGYSYDATILLLKAIVQAAVLDEDGTLIIDPYAVRDAFYSLEEFIGLTGVISCSPLGDCATSSDGKVYEFTSGDPDTFNPGPADSLSSNPSQVWP